MDSVNITLDSLRELNRMMYTMYKFFNYTLANSPRKDYRDFTPEDSIHLQLKPSDYYNFECGDCSIRLYQIRTHYTLKMCGITTKRFRPFRPASDFKYVNCFGDFSNLEDGKKAFYLVTNDYISENLGALF